MNIPKNLKYTKSHEWILMNEDSTASIGLTDYAQDALGDLVFVNLPEPEDELTAGEAVSDVYSPVDGKVLTVNEDLLDSPESINSDPYGAWLITAGEITGTEELLTPEEYEAFLETLDD